MALNDTYRATVFVRGNRGTLFLYDFGYVDTTIGSAPIDMNTAAGNFQTLVQAALAAVLPDVVSMEQYRFACVAGTQLGQVGYVVTSPEVDGGISSTSALPGEMCISFKRNTGWSSRRDRGRVFFGPVDGGFQSTLNPDDVQITAPLQTACDLLKANLTVTAHVLKPVILAANGTYSGRVVIHTAIGRTFIHRRSRRFNTSG